jgi:hypothetical protein
LKDLPEGFREAIFEHIFEEAKIAKMTNRDLNIYLKNLTDMSIIKSVFNVITAKK